MRLVVLGQKCRPQYARHSLTKTTFYEQVSRGFFPRKLAVGRQINAELGTDSFTLVSPVILNYPEQSKGLTPIGARVNKWTSTWHTRHADAVVF